MYPHGFEGANASLGHDVEEHTPQQGRIVDGKTKEGSDAVG